MGLTALHWAALRNKADYIRILLRHGADPERQDSNERTAAQLAQRRKYMESSKVSEIISVIRITEFFEQSMGVLLSSYYKFSLITGSTIIRDRLNVVDSGSGVS